MEFPEDMPEEVRQQIEHHQMIVISHGHEVHRFINELNEEQLDTLRGILMNYWDRPTAAFLVGTVATTLVHKFDRCPVCGEKHDEALHDMAGDGDKQEVSEDEQYKNFHGTKLTPMSEEDWTKFIRILPKTIMDALHDYNLGLMPGVWPMVICKGCGLEYVSIEDRMLRSTDGCHGCHEKSKTG